MSAIDCIDHVHIGEIKGLASIYWPLYKCSLSYITDKNSDENIEVSSFSTLFGGGSGEHPALYVLNDAVVLQFLMKGYFFSSNVMSQDLSAYKDEKTQEFFKKLNGVFDNIFKNEELKRFWYWTVNKNNWDFDSFLYLYNHFERLNFNKNIKEKEYENTIMRFEMNLIDLYGAIIVEYLPVESLKNKDIKELLTIFRDNKDEILKYSRPDYMIKLLSLFEIPKRYYGRNLTIKGNTINSSYSLKNWEIDYKK